MAVSATLTGATGPGLELTAAEFTNVTNINVDFLASVIKVTHRPNGGVSRTSEMAYTSVATVTWTISGATTTITFA